MRLPPRPDVLAGREALLGRLDSLLTGGDQPRTVVLCGLGGVGKTSVAVEYAHRHLAEVGVAWQVAAGDLAVLAAELAELAAQLAERDVADPRDPVASVHAVLAACPGQWLLVFDNAIDEASVRRFLPPAGRGRVLITSQNAHWRAGQVLDVPVLSADVAAGFLVNRTADPDYTAARELAGELGGLPLALEQAAAFIDATGQILGVSLAGYLRLFRQRRAGLLSRGEVSAHPASVTATLALALSRLQEDAPAAAGLLRLLACLAPEPVPLGLLLAGREALAGLDPEVAVVLGPLLGDQVAAGDAATALRRYSLITPAGNQLVLVHRLVQAITLDQAGAERARSWQRAAAALIEAAIPADPALPVTWPACAALLPHAQAVLADGTTGIARVADYLGSSGSYQAARDLWQKITLARESTCGPEHPDTLTARHHLAYWTGTSRDRAAARDLFAELLPVRERIQGPGHPGTLDARANLARWTGEAGDPARARGLFAELLTVCARVQGAEHPETLRARSHLAWWTGQAGDPMRARDLNAELLLDMERVFGPEHPNVLADRQGLARWTGEAGDPAQARDLLAELLPVRERVSGPEHAFTLSARRNLDYWTRKAQDAN